MLVGTEAPLHWNPWMCKMSLWKQLLIVYMMTTLLTHLQHLQHLVVERMPCTGFQMFSCIYMYTSPVDSLETPLKLSLMPTDIQKGDQQCQESYCNATCSSMLGLYTA